MPSPVGHALAGVAAAWLIGSRLPPGWRPSFPLPFPRRSAASVARSTRKAEIALFSAAAIVPDLDLLFGTHSTYTHSVGAVILVFVLTVLIAGARQWHVALGMASAWGSHLLLDWLGNDTSAPIGIMALWPFDAGYYQSPFSIFDAISRRYWLPEQFIVGNLKAAIKEVMLLGPIFAVALWLRRKSSRLQA
jgi:inner membrane protein